MYHFFIQQQLLLAAMKMQVYEESEDNIIDMELCAFIIGDRFWENPYKRGKYHLFNIIRFSHFIDFCQNIFYYENGCMEYCSRSWQRYTLWNSL